MTEEELVITEEDREELEDFGMATRDTFTNAQVDVD